MKTKSREWIKQRLIELRTKRGTTQNQLAREIGIKLRTYQSYEEGRAAPSIFRLQAICKAHGISVDSFLSEASQDAET